jgi:hypothetical protein
MHRHACIVRYASALRQLANHPVTGAGTELPDAEAQDPPWTKSVAVDHDLVSR